jgi:hypothetical protein
MKQQQLVLRPSFFLKKRKINRVISMGVEFMLPSRDGWMVAAITKPCSASDLTSAFECLGRRSLAITGHTAISCADGASVS